jgi:hypothetical protein
MLPPPFPDSYQSEDPSVGKIDQEVDDTTAEDKPEEDLQICQGLFGDCPEERKDVLHDKVPEYHGITSA